MLQIKPTDATHRHSIHDGVYYKQIDSKWYRWSQTMPTWDCCGTYKMNIERMVNDMAHGVRLDDQLVQEASAYAKVTSRSVPKQIEHWVKIGRIAEDNPDLPYEFIRDSLLAQAQIEFGMGEKYVRKKDRS